MQSAGEQASDTFKGTTAQAKAQAQVSVWATTITPQTSCGEGTV